MVMIFLMSLLNETKLLIIFFKVLKFWQENFECFLSDIYLCIHRCKSCNIWLWPLFLWNISVEKNFLGSQSELGNNSQQSKERHKQ